MMKLIKLLLIGLVLSVWATAFAADVQVGTWGEVYKCDVEECGESGCCKDYDLYEVRYGDLAAIDAHLWEMFRRGAFLGESFTRNHSPEGKWTHSLVTEWGAEPIEQVTNTIWALKGKKISLDKVKSVFLYKSGMIFWLQDRSTKQDAIDLAAEITASQQSE